VNVPFAGENIWSLGEVFLLHVRELASGCSSGGERFGSSIVNLRTILLVLV